MGFRKACRKSLEKYFGLIVVLVPTIDKARSIRTMAKWPFLNNVVSKFAIFDPLPLLLACGQSLPECIISTTPLRHWGFWQHLPFRWTTLRGKHFRHPIAMMEVVDTFEPNLPILILGYPSPYLKRHRL